MRRESLTLIVAGCIVCAPAVLAAAGPRTYQTTNMFRAGMPGVKLAGGATLFRSKQAVEMRIATSGLTPNTANTVWWVIFNNPAGCSAPGCGADDLLNPAARAAVFYAAGFVTVDGSANVTAHVEAGALPEGVEFVEGTAGGLEPGNGFGAEIHLVVRTHGAITPGSVDQQIGTFNGGCAPACFNVQAAVFLPVQ